MSTLGGAPAVPDMATQRRCNNRGRVSAVSDLRYSRSLQYKALAWLVVAALSAWALTRSLIR